MRPPALRRTAAALAVVATVATVPMLAECRSREGRPLDPACTDPAQAGSDCPAACRTRGVVVVGERGTTSSTAAADVHATSKGCAACGPLAPGAPAGAPCQAASVCQEVCCDCAGSPGRYVARVCNAGTCATGAEACAFMRDDADLCPR